VGVVSELQVSRELEISKGTGVLQGMSLPAFQTLAAELEAYFDASEPLTLRKIKNEIEVFAVSRALRLTHWNRKQAAKLLKISYRGLLYKIRQHNIKQSA
jgi:DNA-binding NtrC family response regulator